MIFLYNLFLLIHTWIIFETFYNIYYFFFSIYSLSVFRQKENSGANCFTDIISFFFLKPSWLRINFLQLLTLYQGSLEGVLNEVGTILTKIPHLQGKRWCKKYSVLNPPFNLKGLKSNAEQDEKQYVIARGNSRFTDTSEKNAHPFRPSWSL